MIARDQLMIACDELMIASHWLANRLPLVSGIGKN